MKEKKVLLVAIIIFCIILVIALGVMLRCKKGTIDATQYGLVANDISAATENTKKMNKLISSAGNNSEIVFTEGDYYFAGDYSRCIRLHNKKNLTIKGENTCFINTTFSPYEKSVLKYNFSNIFSIENSENITISGINLDYDAVTNVCGEVVKTEGQNIIIKPFENFTNIELDGVFVTRINTFSKDGTPIDEMWFDETVGETLKTTENGLLKVKGSAKKGEYVSVVFSSGTYACPTIFVMDTKGLAINNVNVYSCPSAVVYAPGGNSDFSFDNFNVQPKTEQNLFASNSDCIHIKSLGGNLTVKNCNFKGIGDDALNVHCIAAKVAKVKKDKNSVTLTLAREQGELPNSWLKSGDVLEFFDRSLKIIGTAKVKSVRGGVITFDELPEKINVGYFVCNASQLPSVLVENCTVESGRARGMLIQTPNATIKNCTFKDLGLAGLLVAPDIENWFELRPVFNMLVEGNTFINCNTRQPNSAFGAISILTNHDSVLNKTVGYIHKDITITGNEFKNCKAKIITAYSVDGIKIKDNLYVDGDIVLQKCIEK